MSKQRKSNVELLRIIAMLLIISFHYVFKSKYNFQELNYNSFIVKTFYFFGELGVNLFILITGYFMVNGKFSLKKLIKLIIEVNFYYIVSILLFTILKNNGNVTFMMLLKKCGTSLFATISNKYWFFTAYILLYILSPYLNIFIHNIKKIDYQKFILILVLLWSIIPTFFGIRLNSTEKLLYFNRFIWLVIIYFIGAYIRLYPIKFFNKKSNTIITAITSFAIMILGIIVIYKFKDLFAKIGTTEVAYFWRLNTVPMLLLSISIFKIFIDLKINYNKFINLLASTTLGVYMLHDGPLSFYIWNTIFKTKQCLNSRYSILYIIISSIIIFIIGAIIDLIRQFIEKHTVSKILDSKFYDKLINKSKKILRKIPEKIM